MKTLLITDMHGENPIDLVKREQKHEKLKQVVFLGDYDTPEVLKELRKLKTKKKFIIGNHDLHYVYELEIGGPIMSQSWERYAKLWDQNPEQKEFVENAIAGRKKDAGLILEDRLENGRKIAYCHGGIVDSGSPDSDAPGYVWQRIHSEENALLNFFRMIEKDYWILFRGHDHSSEVVSLRKNPAKLEYPVGERIDLAKDKFHIVTIGPFFYGYYALFDAKTGVLEYKNTGEGHKLRGP